MSPPPTDENEPNAVFGGGNPRRCKDARTHIRVTESPISNEHEFNQFLTKHHELSETNNLAMIKSYLETNHKLVMTHGDLHPRNIMVVFTPHQNESSAFSQKFSDAVCNSCYSGSQIEIKAITDWEMCGWYPEYWEYIKTLNTIPPDGYDDFEDWWVYLPPSIGA